MGGGGFSSRRNFFHYQIPCMNFFHLIFPYANIFLVLRPPPSHHTFSNGPSVNRLRLSRCATTQKSEETGCKQLTLYKYLTAAVRYVSSSVVMGTGNVLASLNSGVLLFCTISVSWSAKSKKRYTTYGLGCIPEKTIADISRAVYMKEEWSSHLEDPRRRINFSFDLHAEISVRVFIRAQ